MRLHKYMYLFEIFMSASLWCSAYGSRLRASRLRRDSSLGTPITPRTFTKKPFKRPTPKDYRQCGQVMTSAWKKAQEDHCGHNAWMALTRMKDHAEQCEKLRYGKDYILSYRELLEQVDTWCSKPKCEGCMNGICQRAKEFPFEPMCSCESGWTGSVCNHTACNPPCGIHGSCFKNKCHCKPGYEFGSGGTCSKAICPGGCMNGGKCIAPKQCNCTKGWKTEGLDAGCTVPVCDPPCTNGAKCTKPGVCECPARKGANGTTLEGFSGPACEKGPQYWFGNQCKDCVELKGHWCLKDGICVKGSTASKDICPKSTAEAFDGYTPTIIFGHTDPCMPEYRRCAEAAEPMIHWVNHDDRLLGGVCGGAVEGFIKEMKDELPKCQNLMITSMDQYVGYLNITEKFTVILDAAVTKHKKECPNDKS